jgi:hypothetical protein
MSISSKKAGFIRCCLGLDKHCSLHLTFINSILTKQLGPIVSLLTIIPATVDSYSLAQAEPLRLSRCSQPLGLGCSHCCQFGKAYCSSTCALGRFHRKVHSTLAATQHYAGLALLLSNRTVFFFWHATCPFIDNYWTSCQKSFFEM